MIAVRLEGRLGNQLFQYAFALSAAKQINTKLYIDQYIEPSVLGNYFKNIEGNFNSAISLLFQIKGFKNLFTFYIRKAYFNRLALWKGLCVTAYGYDAKQNEIVLKNNTIYVGYFQSELFFKKNEDLIRNKYVLKKKFIDHFNLKYNSLYQNNKIVTVHVRRTDYLNLEHFNLGSRDLSLPITYYKNAIATYDKENVHFIFISDDIDFVYQNFRDVKNKTVSTGSTIIDFQHLLNADVCIISNSTFSWWGAWLNKNPQKKIYAPKYFMGWRIKQEVPESIYPESWIQIDI